MSRGPRGPIDIELSLSAIGAPWPVVRAATSCNNNSKLFKTCDTAHIYDVSLQSFSAHMYVYIDYIQLLARYHSCHTCPASFPHLYFIRSIPILDQSYFKTLSPCTYPRSTLLLVILKLVGRLVSSAHFSEMFQYKKCCLLAAALFNWKFNLIFRNSRIAVSAHID